MRMFAGKRFDLRGFEIAAFGAFADLQPRKARFGFIDPVAFAEEQGAVFTDQEEKPAE